MYRFTVRPEKPLEPLTNTHSRKKKKSGSGKSTKYTVDDSAAAAEPGICGAHSVAVHDTHHASYLTGVMILSVEII